MIELSITLSTATTMFIPGGGAPALGRTSAIAVASPAQTF